MEIELPVSGQDALAALARLKSLTREMAIRDLDGQERLELKALQKELRDFRPAPSSVPEAQAPEAECQPKPFDSLEGLARLAELREAFGTRVMTDEELVEWRWLETCWERRKAAP